jgi:hypothetical protein
VRRRGNRKSDAANRMKPVGLGIMRICNSGARARGSGGWPETPGGMYQGKRSSRPDRNLAVRVMTKIPLKIESFWPVARLRGQQRRSGARSILKIE